MPATPRLYCGPGKFQALLTASSVANRDYGIPFWSGNPVIHTLVKNAIQKSPNLDYEREVLELKDGGAVALDWLHPDTSAVTPTVLILPGLTGSSVEPYVTNLALECKKLGFKAVVFNNRGNGGLALKTSKMYCASNVDDLEMVVQHVRQKCPNTPLLGCGFSLGGIILFTYLSKMFLAGHDRTSVGVDAAFLVSSPWDPWEDTKSLESSWLIRLINRRLAYRLCLSVSRNRPHFDNLYDIDHVLSSRLLSQFDTRFTAPMFGYPTLRDYYRDAAMRWRLDDIQVPTLCLTAADDFFAPPTSIPIAEIQKSANVALLMTSHGGHLGFMTDDDLWPNGRTFVEKVFAEFSRIVLDHLLGRKDEHLAADDRSKTSEKKSML